MGARWLITDDEDERMQGLSAEAQVLYVRAFRRHMEYATGLVELTYGMLKRCLEYLPDPGANVTPRRVADISNHYIRARIAELSRAGLVEALPKRSRFDHPRFRCAAAPVGDVRPEKEPQGNRKEGTARGAPRDEAATVRVSGDDGASGTAREPQEGNRKSSGSQGMDSPPKGGSSRREEGARDALITLPLNDGAEHPISPDQLDQWQELFPAVDVMQALRSMRAWCLANPSRRKTRRGVQRFVVGWLEREQNRGGAPPRKAGDGQAANVRPLPRRPNRQEALEERNREIARMWAERKRREAGNA